MTEGPNTPPAGDPNRNDAAAGGPQGAPPPAGPPSGGPGGAPPPAPQAPSSATGVGQPADLGTRFLAKLIDWILLAVVIGVIIVPLTIGMAFSGANATAFGGFGFSLGGIVVNLVLYGLSVGYFVFLESNRGQTLGKMMLKLRVEDAQGNNPSLEQAFKRNAYILLAIVPFLGGLAYLAAVIYIAVTINNNTPTHQGWHDQFADGTRVVKVG